MRKPQLIIAVVIALIGIISFYSRKSSNPVTGETQHVGGITPEQEVALGLQSAPQMAEQFGGLDPDEAAQSEVKKIGADVSGKVAAKMPYPFEYHLLADPETVNAFALPGGQIFITRALYNRLQNEAQLAGVLGHETGHVVGRHAAEHMAKSQLTGALIGAAGVAASDPNDPYRGQRAAMMAGFIGQMVNLKYGRNDELEADTLGVRFMSEATYNPNEMLGVMKILEKSGGSSRAPEFMASHPNPGNRSAVIQDAIAKLYPSGVPSDLRSGEALPR